MTFDEFAKANRERSEASDGFNHKMNDWSLSDWMVALCGEAGEAANVVKKLNRRRDGIQEVMTTADLYQQLSDECADIFCYLDLFCQAAGIDLEKAIISKWNKVSRKISYDRTVL